MNPVDAHGGARPGTMSRRWTANARSPRPAGQPERGRDGSVQARGGGASLRGSAERPISSVMKSMPTSRMHGSQRTAAGGGSEVMAVDQPARIPPQASMAFSEITFDDVGAGSRSSGEASGLAAQHSSAGPHSVGAQHDGAAVADEQQHVSDGAAGAVAATRCWSASSVAGSSWLALAQARSSAGVLQQQLEKHCSAVAQPHGLSMQGKGRERSFPASRSAAGAPVAGRKPATGSGRPETTSP